jgi:hypothetical protein
MNQCNENVPMSARKTSGSARCNGTVRGPDNPQVIATHWKEVIASGTARKLHLMWRLTV